ncbi:MAG: hypothetical protein FWD45_06145 [Coriobacteriia bacterium]|nr:hypothetical protein [Coriobacteriia bacterium]
MSKISSRSAKNQHIQPLSKEKVLSVLGGTFFLSTVVGFTITRNQRLREEITQQIINLLAVSKSIIQQTRFVIERIDNITQLLRVDRDIFAETAITKGLLGFGSETATEERTNVRPSANQNHILDRDLESQRFILALEEYDSFWER